jgi:vacuolar-type H+-ATPase subunit I/STV1
MDQYSAPTVENIINATEDFLKSQIVQKDERIANLESHISTVTQRSYTESAERNRMRNEMQEWTLEALENGTFDESTAQEIADICGFELTKEFELEVTVLYSITVNARDEESAQNAIHDIDFDTVQYSDENISWLSSSVDRIDI